MYGVDMLRIIIYIYTAIIVKFIHSYARISLLIRKKKKKIEFHVHTFHIYVYAHTHKPQ